MRQLLRFLGLLLASAALLRPGEARAQGAAFSCDGTFYQIKQPSGQTTSFLYRVDRSTGAYTTQPLNVNNGTNDLGVRLNSLAYNPQDGYLYALTSAGPVGPNNNTAIYLYKIGQGGIVLASASPVMVGTTNVNINSATATFDKSGNYYFSSQNTTTSAAPASDYNLYKIVVANVTPTSVPATTVLMKPNITMYDFALNPLDGQLYGAESDGTLWKINPTSGAVTVIDSKASGNTPADAVGSVFFDIAGNLYGYTNGVVTSPTVPTPTNGIFYKINITNGAYTLISRIDPASVSDGASCINPGQRIDVTKTAVSVTPIDARTFDITYNIRVRNTYTATDAFVQVSDILTGSTANSTFPTASSITITSGPVVTNTQNGNTPAPTLVANAGYTGLTGNAGLLDGNQPLAAGQQAIIAYTVRVAFATPGSVPTTAQNNTAYATSTSTGPNKGYILLSDGSLLPPAELVANDASSNSAAYPTPRGDSGGNLGVAVDAPSPTPVTFPPSISGTVFEDVNYGGGLGRNLSTSGVGRPGARVELYDGSGALATFDQAVTTGSDGSYAFLSLTAGNTYTVRVVNNTVTSSRNTGNATGLLAVQTYRTTGTTGVTVADGNRVGGEYPARADISGGFVGSTLQVLSGSAAQSISAVALPATNAAAANVDFGYNFDTVVNTNNAGQGSLRQFILNANALDNTNLNQAAASTGGTNPVTGVETSIFMIPDGNAHDGLTAYNAITNPGLVSQLTNGVALISPTAALDALAGTYAAFTSIDGTTQTQNVGNTNDTTLGAGGTVGTAATALGQLNGPEVQLTGSTSIAIGLDVATSATNTTIKGLAVLDFGNALDSNNNANIRSAADNLLITQNVLGTTATSFTAPPTLTNADNVRLTGGTTGVTVSNNLIGFSNSKGVAIKYAVVGASLTGNEIRSNGQGNTNYDGVDVQGTNNIITNNLFTGNGGQGIDSYRSAGSNTITGNTVTDNGRGTANLAPTETPGIRIYGAGNSLSQNIISDNYGAGIMLEGTNANPTAVSTTVMSQNSIYNNGNVVARNGQAASGEIGIDLLANGNSEPSGTTPFVTLNDLNDSDVGANGLLNFPVLTSINVSSSALVITGYARPGSQVEFFLAQANPASVNPTGANFGQGQSYLATRTEGSSDDTNSGTGTYGANGASTNGFNQGTDNTNLFTFSIPLSGLTSAQVTALQSSTALLTSTATLSNATSEFSGNLAVPVADVTVSLNGGTTLYAGQPTGTYTAVFTNEGPNQATNVTRIVTLPAGSTLTTTQRQALTSQGASISSDGLTLTFAPLPTLDNNATSTVRLVFTAPTTPTNTGGSLALAASTSADSQGTNLAPDQTSLSLNILGAADATTAVAVSASATTGTITATFGNNGPQSADGLTPTVQLPAGLALTSTPTGWAYNQTTGLLTYSTTNSSLNSGSSLAVTITYPLSTAPAAPVTAVASITTTTDEAGRTANNVAQATMPSQFDLITTLSGPTSALASSPVTLLVTTTNNGPNLGPDATQTVSIPSAASLAGSIFITNGGTYSYSGGVGTVTFPKLANVPAGQTVTNSISFPAPGGSFAPSAVVSSTGTELSTTNNTAYLNGAASSTTLTVMAGTGVAVENEVTTISTTATMVAPGTVVSYTVTSANKGGAGATASATVTQKVQLLPGLTSTNLKVGGLTATGTGPLQFATTGGTTSYDPTTGVLTYYQVTQAPGDAATTYPVIALTVPSSIGNNGQLVATAVVSTNLKDNVPGDNTASVGVLVQTTSDVTTTITGPSSTPASLPASYVVRFVNNGTTNASGVTETAQLPANLAGGVSILDASGTAVSGASYNPATGLVTLPSQATLAAGAQQQYTLVLTAPAQTFPVSSAVASTSPDGVSTNNAASLSTTVTPNGDLAVSISGPPVAVVGNAVTYLVTTTNNGPTVVSNAVVKLQLPTGLMVQGSGPGGAATIATSNGLDTYTFPTITTLVPGGSATSYLTFTMPNASTGLVSGLASVSSATTDLVASNNTAGLTTSIDPATTAVADLRTSITLNSPTPTGTPATVPAGSMMNYTVAYRNAGDGSGAGATATNVVPTASLPAGLLASDLKLGNVTGTLAGNVITFSSGPASGATYNVTTGIVTFPTIASATAGTAANASYTVAFTAPVGSGQLVVGAQVTSATSDNVLSNNAAFVSTTLGTVYDVTTAIAGPATAQPGTTASYTVTTLNAGPSTASTTTTQNVTGLPTSLGIADLRVDGLSGTGTTTITFKNSAGTTVATYTASSGTLALADIANLPAGAANAVVHSFSFPMPASGSVTPTANVASTGETVNNLTNTASATTTQANIAPVAQNVWNSLQSPRGNTSNAGAAKGLPISPLNATDANGPTTIASYTLVTVPDANTQGALYINGSGSALTVGAPLTLAQISQLTFAPVASYVGDVTFTYSATDNGNGTADKALTSPVVNYTIVVAQDQSTTYATYNTSKGGANPYVTGDMLATTQDPNTDTYNSAGLIYNATTGILQTGVATGVASASYTGTLPNGVTFATAATSIVVNGATVQIPAGTVYVSNASLLPRVTAATNYNITVTTTDLNGGVNQVPVTITLGAYPLPVELVAFTAQTVLNRDGLLKWTTASELHNDHFEVERSLDGASFTKLGQVAGQGSKASATDYTFTDAGIGPKVASSQPVYYRLRQVDADGTASYSPVRVVSFTASASATVSLYPNPASAATGLDLSALPATGTYQVLLLDATGRQVRQATLGGGLVQALDLHELATGTYQVLVTGQRADGSALRQVLRLTKE